MVSEKWMGSLERASSVLSLGWELSGQEDRARARATATVDGLRLRLSCLDAE
jgi:hypothetical protein